MTSQPPLPEKPATPANDGPLPPLPPVEAPSAGFIMQLFLIPLIIVSIIVVVWMMFSWLAHLGSDPLDLVKDLRSTKANRWQTALTLSNHLRNPEHAQLLDDKGLAAELADVLSQETPADVSDPESIKGTIEMRVFLCRALGEFHVATPLPALIQAAAEERSPDEITVRRAAVEAIAILDSNLPEESLSNNDEVIRVLIKASQDRSNNAAENEARENLRATAAFALGVIGGEAAQARLRLMLDDAAANVRYNAATGLARHGDLECTRVLMEMLDPDNPHAVKDEQSEDGRKWKRVLVMNNAIRAITQLAEQHPDNPFPELRAALQNVIDNAPDKSVQVEAREVLDHL